MLQKAIIFIFTLGFVWADVIPNNINEDTIDTTQVTGMPFGFYKEKMEKGTYKVVDKEDLREYQHKRIFSGYGTFDIEEKHCKNVENSANKLTFKNDFEKINVYNNNTFAVSRGKYTYSGCSALAQKYLGEVYSPKDAVENMAVSKGYFYEDEVWLGIRRANCTKEYINSDGIRQDYHNFLYINEPCDETRRYVYKDRNSSTWKRTPPNAVRKCAIRIETNDYNKPIKICAPWWRIESSFINTNKESLIWGGKEISLDNFLMPDVPQRVTVCTEKEVLEETETVAPEAKKRVYCKKYYSRKAGNGNSGQCLEEPIQPSCEVNECAGYIENNCNKIEQLETYKDYNWGYIVKNGENVRVKIDDKIKTFVYECPAHNPNSSNCIKREDIVVFPKECPTSQCDQLRMCIQSNEHTAKWCKEQYPCEKVYGDNRYSPVYDASGNISALKAKCTLTGEVIENDQIRQMSYSKTDCLRYEEVTEEEKNIKKCISEKTKTSHTVDATISEPDIYAYDPDCVRTNNIEDARPYVDAVFDYTNRGFFTTVIEKAYISGENNETIHTPDAANALPYQIPNIKSQLFVSGVESSTIGGGSDGGPTEAECNGYFGENWINTRLTSLFSDSSIEPVGVIHASSASAPYPFVTVIKAFDCSSAASNVGQTNVTDEITYEDYPFSSLGINSNADLRGGGVHTKGYCALSSDMLIGDNIVKQIKIDAGTQSVEMSTMENTTNKELCEAYSSCLGLTMATSFAGNEISTCVMNDGDEEPAVDFEPKTATTQSFVETEGSIATTIDGTKDMIVIQEYAPGRFGYFSNSRFQLPKNNIVKLNNREVFPFISQSAILEPLNYKYDVYLRKETVKNKSPSSYDPYFETLSFGAADPGGNASSDNNYGAAALGGAAAGITAAAVGLTTLAATGVGVLVVVVILFFAGNKRFGVLRTHWDIKKVLSADTPYVENPYGYEFRLYDPAKREYTYEMTKFQTGMLEKGEIEKKVDEYGVIKKESLNFAGYSQEQIQSTLLRPCEASAGCVGYPGKIKWYKFSGRKATSETDNGVMQLDKPVNTIYMGAVNTVTIFVPYKGDYEVLALDKNKNILGKQVITDSDFIDVGVDKHAFAKVMFSLSPEFQLAEGMEDGNTNKACRYDNFTEWGGGVSGVYYEEHTPDGHKCSKSNDQHVSTYAAHYIKFKAVDADKYFEVKLKKPMPYANRFYFSNIGMLEKRNYECYKTEEPCQP